MKNIQSKISGYVYELVNAMNEKGLKDSDIVRAGIMAYAEKTLTKEEREKAMNRARSIAEKEAYEKLKRETQI